MEARGHGGAGAWGACPVPQDKELTRSRVGVGAGQQLSEQQPEDVGDVGGWRPAPGPCGGILPRAGPRTKRALGSWALRSVSGRTHRTHVSA